MNTTNLIDGNALGHAFQRATKLSVGDFETQAVFGMVKCIRDVINADPGASNLVLWDGRAQFRFDILPGYKGSRELKEQTDAEEARVKQSYRRQVPFIKKAISLMGVRQMTCANLEADDLAGYFAGQLSSKGQRVNLITGDSDWMQLVGPNVSWLDIRGEGKRVNHANFFEMTGYYTPAEYLQAKAMIGDSTDDIPPIGGIGKGGAPEFMAQFRSVEEFWRRCDTGEFVPTTKAMRHLWQGTSDHSKEEWQQGWARPDGIDDKQAAKLLKKHMDAWPGQSRANWIRNMKLMDLIHAPKPDPAQCKVDTGVFNEDVFKEFCERLVFRSILRDWPVFIGPLRQSWASRQLPVAA